MVLNAVNNVITDNKIVPKVYIGGNTVWNFSYVPVEYIRGTGTQYILTDIVPTYDTKVEVDAGIEFIGTSPIDRGAIFGIYAPSGTTDEQLKTYGGSYAFFVGYDPDYEIKGCACYRGYPWTPSLQDAEVLRVSSAKASRSTYVLTHDYMSVNSEQKSISDIPVSQPEPRVGMAFFGAIRVNENLLPDILPEHIQLSIYEITISDNVNTVVHHLIPVERQPGGKLGLYDTITQRFYSNSGTGEFIKGDYIKVEPVYDSDKIALIKLDNSYKDTEDVEYYDSITQVRQALLNDPDNLYRVYFGDDYDYSEIDYTEDTISNTNATNANYSFQNCISLYSCRLPEGLSGVGTVFNNCENLSIVELPTTLTEISNGMFDYCPSFKTLNINSSNTVIIRHNILHNNVGIETININCPVISIGELLISSTNNCKLTTITFGDRVKTINTLDSGYGNIFDYWSNTTTIHISNSVESIDSSFCKIPNSDYFSGKLILNIDNTENAITGSPWGGGSNTTINWLR